MEKRKDFKFKLRIPCHIIATFLCIFIVAQEVKCSRHVENYEINVNDHTSVISAFDSSQRIRREATSSSSSTDPICVQQKKTFLSEIYNSKNNINGTRIETKHSFDNESNLNLALAWAGKNDDGVLIAVTTDSGIISTSSNLWRSVNFGRNWTNQNDEINGDVIRKGDGVQRNPHNPKKIYLLTNHEFIYKTEDGGLTWHKAEMTAKGEVPATLVFHSSSDKEDYIMAISNTKKLYVTTNNWEKYTPEGENVVLAVWGTEESGNKETVYCMVATDQATSSIKEYMERILSGKYQKEYQLCKFDTGKRNMKILLKKVSSFGMEGKFLYASTFKEALAEENAAKIMKISTNAGATWNEAQLPTLTEDRFYSVLDTSEGLIFMHVDNPGDTGHGILYTSSGKGIIYSISLERHLYPNFGKSITDFYKVESMRGVYFASQIDSDDSIHSMITFNRGATWQHIKAPDNSPCKSKVNACSLQIHNMYSVTRGIKSKLPLSVPDAKGLILVHGHAADALQTTEPDVFLSSDGGYTWRKVLDGPHHYQIADSGGLILAISLRPPNPKTILFSTDEGHCWHEYEFTEEDIHLTGLLTEPGGKSLTVSIWGYHKDTRKWKISVIDFGDVITKSCTSDDYEDWVAHETLRKEEYKNVEGCLLGKKETFKKQKKDSWCKNTYFYKPSKVEQKCACTREDYECEVWFQRPAGSDLCFRSKDAKSSGYVCVNGDEEKVVTNGYRKIPGDDCVDGFQPSDKLIDLSKDCNEEGDKQLVKQTETSTSAPVISSGNHFLLTIVIAVVLIVVVTAGAFFLYKLYLLRKHKVVYRYSLLKQNQTENQDFDANLEGVLTNTGSLYNDSSDEEQDTARSNGNPFEDPIPKPKKAKNGTAPVRSYHDDSDDDLLN